jgi:hypothetical protein
VNVSSTVRVDAKLTIGSESQTVTVEANALAPRIDSNVVSSLISSEQITSIATQNRNILMLIEDAMAVSSRPRFALIPSAEVEVSAPTRDGKSTSRPG